MRRFLVVAPLLLLAVLAWSAAKTFPHRWVYVSRQLRSDQDVEQIVSVILSDLDQHTAALVKDGVMYQFS